MFPDQPEYDDAFNRIYKAHYSDLHYFAFGTIRHWDDAEMIVTNAFVKVHRQKKDLDEDARIHKLLYCMVFNGCMDYFRRQKTEMGRLRELGYIQANSVRDIPDFERKVQEAELMKKLSMTLEALEELPEKSQDILKKLFLEGYSVKEYAALKGITVSSAHNLKNYALQLLRKRLAQQDLRIWLILCFLMQDQWGN